MPSTEIYAERLARGCCVRCGAPNKNPEKTICVDCLGRLAETDRVETLKEGYVRLTSLLPEQTERLVRQYLPSRPNQIIFVDRYLEVLELPIEAIDDINVSLREIAQAWYRDIDKNLPDDASLQEKWSGSKINRHNVYRNGIVEIWVPFRYSSGMFLTTRIFGILYRYEDKEQSGLVLAVRLPNLISVTKS